MGKIWKIPHTSDNPRKNLRNKRGKEVHEKILKVGKEVHENYINGLFFKKKKRFATNGPFQAQNCYTFQLWIHHNSPRADT